MDIITVYFPYCHVEPYKEDRKTESNVLRPKPLHILPALPSTPKPRLQQDTCDGSD